MRVGEPTQVVDRARFAVFDDASDGVLVTDAQLESPGPFIVYTNHAFSRLTGYDPKDARGKSPRMFQGPRTDRHTTQRMRARLAAGDPFSGTLVNYDRHGREYLVHLDIRPLRDERGRVSHFVASQRDVTDERTTRKRALRLDAMLEALDDSVVMLGPDQAVRYVNHAFAAMVGSDERDLVGRFLHQLACFRPALEQADLERVFRDLEPGDSWRGEIALWEPTRGVLNVHGAVTRIDEPGHDGGFVIVGRDVTEEQRLAAVASALNMTDNTGYIFAGLRHELGNPVNSLKSALTVVRRSVATFPLAKVENYLDRMLDEVARMEYLLSMLKSVNPSRSLDRERVDVQSFMDHFERLIEPDLSRRGVTFRRETRDADVAIAADPRALHQVLLNLITNAADAVVTSPTPHISITLRPRPTEVEIGVRDNGIGMTPEQRDRVFRPFHTSKDHGTGLGLTIAQRLTAQMNGTLVVHSRLGHGTHVVASFLRS